MQNFFGFITYAKDDFSLSNTIIENRYTTFSEEHHNYNFFLSFSCDLENNLFNDQTLLLFFKGEIFNKSSLRSMLMLENSSSLSTAELLKESYLKWGVACFKKIEGNYSIIIYDKEEEFLYLVKDKIGIVPLHFYQNDNIIIFGSRLRHFQYAPHFTPEISPQSLAVYLQFGYMIQPNTIFKNCYKIKSGEIKHFDLKKKNSSSSVHWSLESCYHEKKSFPNEFKIVNEAHELLNNSVAKLQPDSDKIAVSLSGGYDSSSMAALLKQQNNYEIESFTIGFEDAKINEAPYAKAIAKHLNIQHHEHYFTVNDALKIIPELSEIYDEPFADHAAAPTIITNELIKKEAITDLVVGDGGDEVFATADDVHFFERIQMLPLALRTSLIKPFEKINFSSFPSLEENYNIPTKVDKFLRIFSAPNIALMTQARNILFRETDLQGMIKGYQKPIMTTFNEINFTGFHETVDEIIGTYFKTSMIDGELVKSYSASNHENISIYAPFLDAKLIDYMAKVPSSIKIKDGTKKYILKEIAHKYISKELLDRPKSGFNVPFGSWMKNEFKDLVYKQINEERLNKDKIFYTSSILKIRDNFYNGHEIYKYKLWRIFLFQLWYEKFKG